MDNPSNWKFAFDIMHFIMKYYNIDWSPPETGLGQRVPLLRFTAAHGDKICYFLQLPFEKDIWKNLQNSFPEMDESAFGRAACRFLESVLQGSRNDARNTHYFFMFSSMVAVFAIFSMRHGYPNAPQHASAFIKYAVSVFDVEQDLCRGNTSKDVSLRTVA